MHARTGTDLLANFYKKKVAGWQHSIVNFLSQTTPLTKISQTTRWPIAKGTAYLSLLTLNSGIPLSVLSVRNENQRSSSFQIVLPISILKSEKNIGQQFYSLLDYELLVTFFSFLLRS